MSTPFGGRTCWTSRSTSSGEPVKPRGDLKAIARYFEIQDESSQLIAEQARLLKRRSDAGLQQVDAKPGDLVMDFCAGSGGKALCIGPRMHNQGQAAETPERLQGKTCFVAQSGSVRSVMSSFAGPIGIEVQFGVPAIELLSGCRELLPRWE